MRIALDSGGAYLEPDDGPRSTRWHMRIVRSEPIPGTANGHQVWLECGHAVAGYGDLTKAEGRIFCTKCRDLAQDFKVPSSSIPPGPRQTATVFYVVYDHPHDYPNEFVCRRWEVTCAGAVPGKLVARGTIGEVRRALPPGLVMTMPDQRDDPKICEIWI